MAYYRRAGTIPPKRHTQHRTPEGGLYSEELMGEEGFSSDSSLLYHRGVPSAIVDATPWALPDQTLTENRPLVPRHLKLHEHSHGPQPGAVERSLGAEFFDELAVMVDTFRPLELGEGGLASEDPGYAWTWAGRGPVA
jgi:hypothetical protein